MTTEATETTIQVTEPEGNTEQEKLSNAGHENVASTEPAMATLDPQQADMIAQQEFQKKYGSLPKKAPVAQRKISAGGGVQYFDSGDYNTAKGKDKKDIASHPHAMALEALQNAKAPLKPKMMAEQGVLKPARRGDKGVSSLASPRKVSSVTSPLAQ